MDIPRFLGDFSIVVFDHSIDVLNIIDLIIPLFDREDFVFLTNHNKAINDFFAGSLEDENFSDDIPPNGKFIICDDVLRWYKNKDADVKWILLVTWGITKDMLKLMKNPTYYYMVLPHLDLSHSMYSSKIDKDYRLTYKSKSQDAKRMKESGDALSFLRSKNVIMEDKAKLRNLSQILSTRPGNHLVYSNSMNEEFIRSNIPEGLSVKIVDNGGEVMEDITDVHLLDLDIVDYSLFMRGALNLKYNKSININYFVSDMGSVIYGEFCSKCDELDQVIADLISKSHKIHFCDDELKIRYEDLSSFSDILEPLLDYED